MKKTVMTEWVKALRSGKFKQGKKLLKQTDHNGKVSHCCLGVLCEIYNKKNKNKKLNFDNYRFLPTKVMNWCGLSTYEGRFYDLTKSSSLTAMNDEGKRFTTIANFIEKEWEKL